DLDLVVVGRELLRPLDFHARARGQLSEVIGSRQGQVVLTAIPVELDGLARELHGATGLRARLDQAPGGPIVEGGVLLPAGRSLIGRSGVEQAPVLLFVPRSLEVLVRVGDVGLLLGLLEQAGELWILGGDAQRDLERVDGRRKVLRLDRLFGELPIALHLSLRRVFEVLRVARPEIAGRRAEGRRSEGGGPGGGQGREGSGASGRRGARGGARGRGGRAGGGPRAWRGRGGGESRHRDRGHAHGRRGAAETGGGGPRGEVAVGVFPGAPP